MNKKPVCVCVVQRKKKQCLMYFRILLILKE